ncbi:MAG TPA: cytochrome c oxidase subunit 3 [Actinomycetota bacterium]|nr:cytochrome c oxidase subunit 3 [Actinomycetota bacterium]
MSTVVRKKKVDPSVIGMILFITSEVMFFGGLLSAYFAARGGHEAWPPKGEVAPGLVWPAVFTAALLASSVTQHRALEAGTSRTRRWVAATIVLGLVFLAGQAWEWTELRSEGLSISSGIFGTLFFTITGAHGLHVIGGLAMLGVVASRWAGDPRRDHLEAATYYWHFVDVVWLVVFVSLYVRP